MPRHALYEPSKLLTKARSPFYIFKTLTARFFLLIITSFIAYYGINEMYGVLSTNSITKLQWVFFALFTVNFIWISYAFSQALLGFLLSLFPQFVKPAEVDADFTTAILLPIYNEDPSRIKAAITAMRNELIKKAPHKYAFFILSDSNKPESWLQEQATLATIFTHDAVCPVYYRKRMNNYERKAGNIADWVQCWGGDFEAMLVLDADSLMSADSLITLSRRLAASPKVGLIQTLPFIIRSKTLYGHLQQFANHCYGPIYARGLSAWHGLTSNFWGHNAIIRTAAFADSCCLPILNGKPPRGGHILSHDFIEAALMRRAGWGVRFDTDIKESYEESPPSLVDVLVRDRRWCQGNLQHLPFMFVQGIEFPTRLHIFSGIMSYLSAVFWLLLIVTGLAIAAQAQIVRPEYFTNPSLFPIWPVFDAERALNLFYVSMAIVLAPKVFGWLVATLNIRHVMQFGNPIALLFSAIIEIILSALYAPILMVSQCSDVYKIYRGKDSGWAPQSRDDGAISWVAATKMHISHTLFGFLLAISAYSLNPDLMYWLSPICLSLILSIPLSKLSGNSKIGSLFSTLSLLRTPQSKHKKTAIITEFEAALATAQPPSPLNLTSLLNDKLLFELHISQLKPQAFSLDAFDKTTVTAEWKIRNAMSLQQLQSSLNSAELMGTLSSLELLCLIKKRFTV